jgi:protein-S-isoprenylcysteine O-methyltransferase Ste14
MSTKGRIVAWFVMIVVATAVALFIDFRIFPNAITSLKFHLLTFPFGVLLMWFVMTVSKNTGRTLAKYGRKGDIPRLETNVLVDKGPYALMRHPMHFGLLFMPLSWGLLIGSPTFIVIIAPLEMLFILLMIKLVEEPEALRKFGDQYREYMKDRPWFCIRIECIKELLRKVEKN